MSEPRVFGCVTDGWIGGETWEHLFAVLRVRTNHVVRLVSGDGYEVRVRVVEAERRRGRVDIVDRVLLPPDPSVAVTLMVGLLKGDQMDAVVQAGTELGLHGIVPIQTDRCVAKGSAGRVERWRRIARSSTAQCGRAGVPVVHEVTPFAAAVAGAARERAVLFWEGQGACEPIHGLVAGAASICILVGPEGGFSEAEVQQARDAGVAIGSLGRRILRAQTAAMLAPALVLYTTGAMDH